jgi:hypothetical protein
MSLSSHVTGKGSESNLEKGLVGETNFSTLDCSVFTDRNEFRKSAEFAWGRTIVRIQEMNTHCKFQGDMWKRFVVNEDLDCHHLRLPCAVCQGADSDVTTSERVASLNFRSTVHCTFRIA